MKKFALLCTCAAIVPIAVATIGTTAAVAQQITTSIQGRVTNESGAAVGGAVVVITDTRTSATTTMTTNSSGSFNATGLTTGGPYTVTANANGFQGQTVEGIQTTLQGPTQLTFALARPSGRRAGWGDRRDCRSRQGDSARDRPWHVIQPSR